MRQVLAIGRHGSFSRAARELGIAQPTLSKSIARLEDELSVRLFDRSGWRARMTPMGEFVVRQAETLVNEARQLDRNVQLVARGELGEVKIGLGPALRTTFMPRLAAAIVNRHPNLRLTITADSAVELRRAVQSGDLDLIILADTAVEQERNLVTFVVMVEPGLAIAAPSHPLVGKSKISIAEFASYDVIGTFSTAPDARILYAMPELAQVKVAGLPFRPRIVTNDLDTTLDLVRQGLGIYAGAEHIVRPALDAGDVVQLDVEWSFTYRAVAAMTSAASLSPLLRQVVSYAQEVSASLVRQRDRPAPSSTS